MDGLGITKIVALVGLGIGIFGILIRIREILNRPYKNDHSRPQGSALRGVIYAFTLGMAPWEKESTRKHWISYFRGIFFHLGIFAAIGIFFLSLLSIELPDLLNWIALLVAGSGAVFGFAGIFMRLFGENERVLSHPDDYFSVFLTSLFIGFAFLVLLNPNWLPVFYLTSALLLIYIPFGKIRHCVYFFYSKFFFGSGFGHRGVIGQPDNRFAK